MQTNLMKNSEYQKDSPKTIRPNGCEKTPRQQKCLGTKTIQTSVSHGVTV